MKYFKFKINRKKIKKNFSFFTSIIESIQIKKNIIKNKFSPYKLIKQINLNISIFVTSLIFFLYLIYISIPGIIYNKSIQNYLTNLLKAEYKIDISLSPKISYSILPFPNFQVEDVIIFNNKEKYQKNLAQIKKFKIFIHQNNFLKKENLKIKSIEISESNFFIENSDVAFFNNFFLNDNFNKPIKIKKSNIFYQDNNKKTISLLTLGSGDIYKDYSNNQILVKTNGKIFNVPFNFSWKKDVNKREINTYFKLKKIRLDIKNFSKSISETKIQKNLQLKYNKSKYNVKYKKEAGNIIFSSNNSFIGTNKFLYSGKISLDPFSFSIISSLNEINFKKIYFTNFFFQEILSKNLLLNENFNGNIKIKSDNLINNPLFNEINLNISFVGNSINLNKSTLTNSKLANLIISNGNLYEEQNDILFKGSFELSILDIKKFNNKFVVPKKFRRDLKKIKFKITYNLTNQVIKIINININDKNDDEVIDRLDDLIYEFNSGGIKISNWIELKSFTNKIIATYSG